MNRQTMMDEIAEVFARHFGLEDNDMFRSILKRLPDVELAAVWRDTQSMESGK